MHSSHFKKSDDFFDEMFDLLFFNIVTEPIVGFSFVMV